MSYIEGLTEEEMKSIIADMFSNNVVNIEECFKRNGGYDIELSYFDNDLNQEYFMNLSLYDYSVFLSINGEEIEMDFDNRIFKVYVENMVKYFGEDYAKDFYDFTKSALHLRHEDLKKVKVNLNQLLKMNSFTLI